MSAMPPIGATYAARLRRALHPGRARLEILSRHPQFHPQAPGHPLDAGLVGRVCLLHPSCVDSPELSQSENGKLKRNRVSFVNVRSSTMALAQGGKAMNVAMQRAQERA